MVGRWGLRTGRRRGPSCATAVETDFSDLLEEELALRPLPPLPLRSPTEVDTFVESLTTRVNTVLVSLVPLTREPRPRAAADESSR